jgi:hypothetical protein
MVSNTVRFYYGEKDGDNFQKLAFDDYDMDKADEHESLLKEQNINYLRIDQ